MYPIVEIINYIFAAILIGVSGAWIILIKSMLISFRDTPYLDKFNSKDHINPKVSVIVPARNEEKLISKCLDSLLNQDYQNYEIVVIDDSSEDSMGKNWACMEGYKKATGELLLCTDSDTKYSQNVISLAVAHLESAKIDALTVIPKMLCLDNWTKITLPMLSTFLHTRFSALRVNDPSKKTGYFFGSFFIIKKAVYEAIGTHEGVKHEIIEDGALGKKVKESGFKLKMVRGEHLLEAVWASNWSTLWNGLKRLMVPLYLQNNTIAIGIFFAVLFLLFMPFPILFYSVVFFNGTISFTILLISSILACCLVFFSGIIDAKKGLKIKWIYSLLAPVGSFIVVAGFLMGMLQAKSKTALLWRGRRYSMKEHVTNSISV